MSKVGHLIISCLHNWHLSLFEKVILVNSVMLVGEALAALWVTSHHLESQHYLIDTLFLVLATLFTLGINILLLRASFRPLFNLLATIRAVSAGKTQARANSSQSAWEISELAHAFNGMLDRLEVARREQTMLILQAQEDERRRIGMELHDEAGQNLTALLIHAEILNQSFQTLDHAGIAEHANHQLSAELLQLTKLTQLTLDNIRVLAQQLRPSVLDDLGLLAAFRWLVEDSEQRLHLHTHLEIQGLDDVVHSLPATYETALFRIAQESLTNIARHAHAHYVSLTLCCQQQNLYLTIRDDGQGYDSEEQHPGTGILGMRERATALGGTLTLSSQKQYGTTVQAIIPLPGNNKVRKEVLQTQETFKIKEVLQTQETFKIKE
ncbi:MAG: HAMP domain-containing sensor histidine kinase [Ktedonobacteraceae bacterium]